MSRLRLRLRKRGAAPADIKKISSDLRMPGEKGRAFTNAAVAEKQASIVNSEGAPAIPTASGRTEIATLLTRPDGSTQFFLQAEQWTKVTFTLETVGPVDIGTRENISPAGSGKGYGLVTDESLTFSIPPGGRIFVTANAVNRVRYIIEPIALGDQILSMLGSVLNVLRRGGKL